MNKKDHKETVEWITTQVADHLTISILLLPYVDRRIKLLSCLVYAAASSFKEPHFQEKSQREQKSCAKLALLAGIVAGRDLLDSNPTSEDTPAAVANRMTELARYCDNFPLSNEELAEKKMLPPSNEEILNLLEEVSS